MSFDKTIDAAIAREQQAIDQSGHKDDYIPGFYRVNYHPDTHEMIGVKAVRKDGHHE
ncbi:hypothetical protein JS528_11220 [Bifidobacterium sp. MA2]|uniref:Uncharacterized protein n=1 Tax=Bifidobacterium santillanense TaxID=2809028 RepID=A0ABS5USA1_9BIFI|nr:hypothetical protein [Bifidobacterium santillanense]MBT1173889.1 hypothetical protein [Bifidobacterium santillanense]